MLLARPIPFNDEAPASILMRAAGKNGWSNVSKMVAASGVSAGRLTLSWSAPERYQQYMNSLGIRLPENAGAFYSRHSTSGRERAIGNLAYLPESIFRDEGKAFCPDCLQIEPYLLRLWSIRLIATCPTHGNLLVDKCHSCGSHLHWNRSAPELCSCGYDLRLSPRIKGHREISQFVIDVIRTGDQKQLDAMCEIFLLLSEECTEQVSTADDQQFAVIAAQIHQDEKKLISSLVEWVEKRACIEHPRLALLPFLRKNNHFKKLAISVLESINDLDIPLTPSVPPAGALPSWDTSVALGTVKSGVICQLADLSLICRKPFKKRSRDIWYTRASIDMLLRRLWKPNRRLRTSKPAAEIAISALIAAIVAEPERNVGYKMEEGLASIVELPNRTGKQSNKRPPQAILNVPQAAALLNVYPDVIRNLIKTGYLIAHQQPDAKPKIFITKDSITRFDDNFICAAALVHNTMIKPAKFVEELLAKGISPVGKPGINGSRIYIFRRADLTAAGRD
jgi:hypothetical protein